MWPGNPFKHQQPMYPYANHIPFLMFKPNTKRLNLV